MKIHIKSDGTPGNTHVYGIALSGEQHEIKNVISVELDASRKGIFATLKVGSPSVDVVAETPMTAWLNETAAHFTDDMAKIEGTSPETRDAYNYVAEYLRAKAHELKEG